ncbi:MAG: uncharacterized protein JWM86_2440 [Thermoleophilia bacterium]|nr:uncharacterized protein [Thermoleophilia bacterium]
MSCDLKRLRRRADAIPVITLNRIHDNGTLLVNADLIETIEATPDTIITLVNRHRYIVAESVDEVVDRIVAFRARIGAAIDVTGDHAVAARTLVATADDEERAA